ncbi:hypothetical protein NDU88_001776 [Pleurodeles waltl]|uniref:Uncharacterized protein n=2 Tax=Pleurodeles waltl TaxID=8319 RepID=A0AAV7WN09_PLEWA|nr:hypothetical protein NDU88_001776 [Pleurodeles waltl]
MLGEKVPFVAMRSNHIDLDTADANGKHGAPEKFFETTNMRTVTDHLEKCAQFSQKHMEATSETICNTAVLSANLDSSKGMFLSPDANPDISSLKQNCKTELFQRDAFHLQKNCKILELTKKSKERVSSNAKQNVSDCIAKTENLKGNPDIESCFQKSRLQKHSNFVPCITENDNPLVCPNILFEAVCLPVSDMAKKSCLKRKQISKCADANHKSRGMQKVCKKEKKNRTCKRDAAIYEANAPQQEHNSPNRTPKRKCFLKKKRKSDFTESVVPENVHSASPVFIPKGTILTVINSTVSKAASKNGDYSKRSKNIAHCNETFLPRPVLFHNSPTKRQKPPEDKSFKGSGCRNSNQQVNAKKQSKLNNRKHNVVNDGDRDSNLQRSILKGSQLTKKVKKEPLKGCFQKKKIKSGCGNSVQEPHSKKQPKLNIRRNNILLNECGRKSHLQKAVLKRPQLTKKENKEHLKDCLKKKKIKFGCRNSKQELNSKKQMKLNITKKYILMNEGGIASHSQNTVVKRPRLTKKEKDEQMKVCLKNKKNKCGRRNSKQEPNSKKQLTVNVRKNNKLVKEQSLDKHLQKAVLKRSLLKEKEHFKDCFQNKKLKVQDEHSIQNESKCAIVQERHLQLIPVFDDQRIKCPRLNQPVVVMNHPDVDSLEIVNIMNTIKKYKGRVLRVFLSERTMQCLRVKQQLKRLICTNVSTSVKEQPMLQVKQSTIHRVSEQTVDVITDESQQSAVLFHIHDGDYQPQNSWMGQGLPLPLESTVHWSSCSLSEMSHS